MASSGRLSGSAGAVLGAINSRPADWHGWPVLPQGLLWSVQQSPAGVICLPMSLACIAQGATGAAIVCRALTGSARQSMSSRQQRRSMGMCLV